MKRRGFFAWVGGLFAGATAAKVEASALPKCDTCGKPAVEECCETIPDGVDSLPSAPVGFAKWRTGRRYWLCADHSHSEWLAEPPKRLNVGYNGVVYRRPKLVVEAGKMTIYDKDGNVEARS